MLSGSASGLNIRGANGIQYGLWAIWKNDKADRHESLQSLTLRVIKLFCD